MRVNAAQKIANELADKMADARAYRIASVAAEGLVRCQGIATSGIDEYLIPAGEEDELLLNCIEHLRHFGEAEVYEADEGIVIRFVFE